MFETVSVAEETKFLIHASYCEIYNEEIRDLLGKDVKEKLELHEHPERGVYVNGVALSNMTFISVPLNNHFKNMFAGCKFVYMLYICKEKIFEYSIREF